MKLGNKPLTHTIGLIQKVGSLTEKTAQLVLQKQGLNEKEQGKIISIAQRLTESSNKTVSEIAKKALHNMAPSKDTQEPKSKARITRLPVGRSDKRSFARSISLPAEAKSNQNIAA